MGIGCLEAKESGRVQGVDLKAESRSKMEWGIWIKSEAAVSWEERSTNYFKKLFVLYLLRIHGNIFLPMENSFSILSLRATPPPTLHGYGGTTITLLCSFDPPPSATFTTEVHI